MTKDRTKSQDAGEDRKFKVPTRMWATGGALLAVGLLSAVLLLRPASSDSPSETDIHVFPPGDPPVITSYDLVEEDFVNMSLHRPFYMPTTLDALREGDILCIRVTGHGLWRQTHDPNSKAFPTMEISPDGPKAPVDSKGREVPINSPEDLPAGYRRDEFPHQSTRMAALVAAVGTVAHDDDGMTVRLDEHFAVGTMRWLRIDGRPSNETQVLFTLNLRWKEVEWHYNEGIFQIITRVYRLHAGS